MRRIAKWVAVILGAVLVLAVVVAAGYLVLNPSAQPDAVALAALQSNGEVTVSQGPLLAFAPAATAPTDGFILYPGGRVDPRAYAPIAQEIAAQGYLVVVPKMPLDLAVLGANRADKVIEAYPAITSWAVGGHSLGGVMAAQYAAKNLDSVDGLALWAAYPTSGVDLSNSGLSAVSIVGTEDGLVSRQQVDDSRSQLPPSTQFVFIDGGNHAQFGSYGAQDGDGLATISAEEQWRQAASATVDIFQ